MKTAFFSRENINSLLLLAIMAWYIVPIVSFKLGTLGLIAMVFLWTVTCNLNRILESAKYLAFFGLWYGYMLLMWLLGLYSEGGMPAIYFFTMTAITVFPLIIFEYYSSENKLNTVLIKRAAVIMFLISAITTLYVLTTYPVAAKILAMSGSYVEEEKNFYLEKGCGGYGFIYSSVLLAVPLMFSKEKSKVWKFVNVFTVILCLYTTLLSQYTLALLISCIAIILAMFTAIKNTKNTFMIKLVFFAVFLIFALFLPKILSILAQALVSTGNGGLSVRLNELATFMNTGEQGYNLSGRTERYGMSLNLFLSKPIFGNQISGQAVKYGGHSSVLDQLARYGVFSAVWYFVFAIYNCRRNKDKSNIVILTYLVFLALSIINTTIYTYQLGIVLFLLAPVFARRSYSPTEDTDCLDGN